MLGRCDRYRFLRSLLLAAVCVLYAGLASAAAEVVYDNTANATGYFWGFQDGWSWGDQITLLDGAGRIGRQLEVGIGSDTPVAADTLVDLYDEGGNPIYSADLGRIAYPAFTEAYVAADLSGVALTDTVSWTVTLSNYSVPTAQIGPLIYDPPVVGSSSDGFFWLDNGTGFQPAWFGGVLPANFAAKVTADVPEPGTLALLATGLAAMGLAVRRRRP